MAKRKGFRSGPRIVSDNGRCTLLIRGCRHMLLPAGRRCFRWREKAKTGSSLPGWPKSKPASPRFEPPSPKAKVSPATTIATKDSPLAIALLNACCGALTAFSQGDWPLTCANAAYARSETDFFRKAFLIAGEFLSQDASRAPHRDSKAMGRLATTSTFGSLRSPSRSTKSGERLPESHEYAQSPVAESRMVSASSDQPCCHFQHCWSARNPARVAF